MKLAFFSATKTDKRLFTSHNPQNNPEMVFFEAHLNEMTARLAEGFDGVCIFVNDQANAEVIQILADLGIRFIALRCAGFNNVNLQAADSANILVMRVPAYSPMAVAEHAVALMLSLNRKTYRAYGRVRDGNFALEGLLGFDMKGKTAGVIGTGRIGLETARILQGFGMRLLGYDPYPNEDAKTYGLEYVTLDRLYAESDIITLHVPLMTETYHMINAYSLKKMKSGVMLINTSRGGLMDTQAVIQGLKDRKIGYLGMDVYEQEETLFFEDHSETIIDDDDFERLITFPNVLITAHQAFFTQEALDNIAEITLSNVRGFDQDQLDPKNLVKNS